MHSTHMCVGSHARETSHKERNPCFSCSCIDYDQTMHSRTSKAYRAFDEQPRPSAWEWNCKLYMWVSVVASPIRRLQGLLVSRPGPVSNAQENRPRYQIED